MKPYHRITGLLLFAMLAPGSCSAPARADAESPGDRCTSRGECTAPDCDNPDNMAERLWCTAAVPDSTTAVPVVEAAVARMQALGGVCAPLATTLAQLLRFHLVRVYDPDQLPGAGAAAPSGRSAHTYLLLSRDLITTFFDAAHRSGNIDSQGTPRPETLQEVLAHEADHLLGRDHIDRDGYLTPNTLRCSDVR